jgi:hypothetical protein
MKYFLVTHWRPVDLVQEVQELLDKGWKPQGGIAISVAPSGSTTYAQAMTLEE